MSRIHEALGRGRAPAQAPPPSRSGKDEAVLAALGYQSEQPRSRRGLVLAFAVVALTGAGIWALWPSLSRFAVRGSSAGGTPRVEAVRPPVLPAPTKAVPQAGSVAAPTLPAVTVPAPKVEVPAAAPATEVKATTSVASAQVAKPTPTIVSTASNPAALKPPAPAVPRPREVPRPSTLDSRNLSPPAPPRDDFQLALYHQRAGDFEQALVHYRAALQRDEMNVEAHNNLGSLYLGRNLLDEAAREFQRVLAIDPGFVPAYINLSATLYKLGRFDAAAAQAREALRLDPRNGDGYVNLALAQKASGQHGESQASLRRALELNSRHPLAHYNLARQYEDGGEFLRAVEHYRQFLQYAGPEQQNYAVDVRARLVTLQARAIR